MKPTRYVVTGATGFLGRRFVRKLVHDGHEVIAFGKRHDAEDLRVLATKYISADLTRPGQLNSFLSHETTIVHLAAIASVPRSVDDPMLDFETNVTGTLHMLESARAF